MSAADAKAHLLELGHKESAPIKLLGNPLVRSGALLVAGLLLGRLFGRRGNAGMAASLVRIASRVGLAAAPMLVDQFVKDMSKRAASHNGHTPPTPAQYPARNIPA